MKQYHYGSANDNGVIRITIPVATPSGNKFAYSHWRVRHASKELWHRYLWAAAPPSFCDENKATGKRRLTVERISSRELDVDNAYSGLKGIIDSLREMGLLMDDDSKSLELTVMQSKPIKGAAAHTILTLENL